MGLPSNLQRITAPSKEAVSPEEVKDHLRLTSDSDLGNLSMYIVSAREYFEALTGRTIHQTKYRYILNQWPAGDSIILPRATPLIAITAVEYYDTAGTKTTWASADYIADTWSQPGRLVLGYGKLWPSFTAYPTAPIRIEYTAGIATTSPISEASDELKMPILMLIAGAYENRESESVSFNPGSQVINMVSKWIAAHVVPYAF